MGVSPVQVPAWQAGRLDFMHSDRFRSMTRVSPPTHVTTDLPSSVEGSIRATVVPVASRTSVAGPPPDWIRKD